MLQDYPVLPDSTAQPDLAEDPLAQPEPLVQAPLGPLDHKDHKVLTVQQDHRAAQ